MSVAISRVLRGLSFGLWRGGHRDRLHDSAELRLDQQYRMLFDCNPVAMWVFDRKSLRFMAVNDAAVVQHGYTRDELLLMKVTQIRSDEDGEFLADMKKRGNGLQRPGLWRHRRKDGSIVNVEVVCDSLKFQGIDAILVAATDVTQRVQAEHALRESQERYQAIFEGAVIGIFQSTDEDGLVTANRALAQLVGYTSPEQMLRCVKDIGTQLVAEPDKFRQMKRLLDAEGQLRGFEVQVVCRDGTRKWTVFNLRATRDPSGKLTLLEGMVEDITGRKAAEARVQFLAYHDPLTGLPNRVSAQDRIHQALIAARSRSEKCALLLFDLDGFKVLNDSLGHTFGDLVLMKIAERLGSCAGPRDIVARIGGDEFLLLLTGVHSQEQIDVAAERVIDAVKSEFAIRGQSMRLTCSIGISLFPEHGRRRNLDTARRLRDVHGQTTTPELLLPLLGRNAPAGCRTPESREESAACS